MTNRIMTFKDAILQNLRRNISVSGYVRLKHPIRRNVQEYFNGKAGKMEGWSVHKISARLDRLFQGEEKLISSILNSIGEGIVIADRNGELLFFNYVAEEILGIGMQKIDPEKWADVYGCFYPDQRTPFPSDRIPLAQTLRTGQVASEIIYIKNPHKPEGVYIDINSRPILGEAGDLWGGIVVFKDITEQKKTEMALKKLSRAVEQTADAVIITTASGIIEYVNPAFENMSGYSKDESIGQTPRLLKSGKHDRSFYQDIWSTLLAGMPYKNEMLNRK
ncbi:PAS domain S-box protein, partial [candidate division KSB1 bacterium]